MPCPECPFPDLCAKLLAGDQNNLTGRDAAAFKAHLLQAIGDHRQQVLACAVGNGGLCGCNDRNPTLKNSWAYPIVEAYTDIDPF